ncbi:hypothetical protein GQ44DRAFT_721349 [Phaeosphaeriaceae sp. PMI808]|nr:hypothetical protein GQ44DRAFT_721349 [Phaeosphaeriaceae sp. PMI808]
MTSPKQHEEDITTFSGFGSWMSTFTPQVAEPYEEDDQSNAQRHHSVHEIDDGQEYYELDGGSTKIGQKNSQVFELLGDTCMPQPVPVLAPIPNQVGELPDNSKVPHPIPAPLPNPIDRPVKKSIAPPLKSPVQTKIKILEIPDPACRIKAKGLKRAGYKGTFEETINLTRYGFLDDIAKKLRDQGYKTPIGFTTEAGKSLPISVPTGFSEAAWPILVTTGRPCYDPDIGLRIHIDEPLTVFLSQIQLSVKCADSRIIINDDDLKIAFHRTLRIPEDGRIHKLPASFGAFLFRMSHRTTENY